MDFFRVSRPGFLIGTLDGWSVGYQIADMNHIYIIAPAQQHATDAHRLYNHVFLPDRINFFKDYSSQWVDFFL